MATKRQLQNSSTLKRSHPFTLLEIFICLTVLGIVGGIVGWQVKGLFAQHQLHNSAHRLTIKLQEAQSIALTYQTSLVFELCQTEKGIAFRTTTDEPLQWLNRALIPLDDNSLFTFNGDKELKNLQLRIYPSGRIEPTGVVKIRRRKGDQVIAIDLSRPLKPQVVAHADKK